MTDETAATPAQPTARGDCYSAGERDWMEYGQRLRARLLAPGLRLMTRLRITPDHMTILAFLFGIAFAPLWLLEEFWLAVSVLWIHVALDGIDGPLARHQQCASPRGSFTDSFCDQLVVCAVTISLMIGVPGVSAVAGSTFLVVYVAVLAIAMVRNTLQIPYSWLLRPRLILYLAVPVQLLGVAHSLSVVIWCSNVILAIKLATGFYKLRGRLDGPN